MTTEQRQIKRDLERHFTNKLRRWSLDCHQICEVAEIKSGEMILLVLLKMTTRALQSAMSKRDFLELMSEAYDVAAQDNAEANRAQKAAASCEAPGGQKPKS